MVAFGGLALAGLVLLAYATVWLWHDSAVYRLHGVARNIRFGHSVTSEDLAQAASDALALDRNGMLRSDDIDDAAQVLFQFSMRKSGSFLKPALLEATEALLRRRLALAPADGNSWLRLAYVHTAHIGLDQFAHAALRMSFETTPREISVMWPSLKFRVDHWNQMTVQEQFASADLVTGLWHKPPERVALKAYLNKLPPHLLSSLLSDMIDPDARGGVLKG